MFDNDDIVDKEVEQLAQFHYHRFIKKQLENAPVEMARGERTEMVEVDLNSFETIESKQIGGEWLCLQAFNELGLPTFLANQLGFNQNQVSVSLLALIGRLLHPASERATAKWINENSAALELVGPASGVVDRNRLMDAAITLFKSKDEIEDYLSQKVRDIFALQDNYFLYDLTNTHFEGQSSLYSKAKYGRNKQKRNDCRQVTLGLLTDSNGLPKRSRYYPGNIGEVTTFSDVLDDLEKEVKNHKPNIIIDSGIASQANLKETLSRGFDYICVSRSAHKQLLEQVDKDKLITFVNKSKQEVKAQFFTQKIQYQQQGKTLTKQEQIMYIETPAKLGKEMAMLGKKRQRFEEGINAIAQSLQKPRSNKSVENINQRIGRLKEKCKGIGQEYELTMPVKNGKVESLSWKYNPDNRAEKSAGKYFIRTSIQSEHEEILWHAYRLLGEIESAFKVLKSDLDMRPIFHQKATNIEAHLNLAVLSYFIVSFIRHRLKENEIHHRWMEIRRVMSKQMCCLSTINDSRKRTVILKTCTRPPHDTAKIYHAMKYKPVPFYRKKAYIQH